MSKVNNLKNSTVNKNKLIYWPLLIGVIAILTVSLASYFISKNLLIKQLEQDGINMAKITTKKISSGILSVEIINNLIDDKIKLSGKTVLKNRENLSNELLIKIAEDFNIDEINWYSPQGSVVYSNLKEHIGWTPPADHNVQYFKSSDDLELVEEIRACTIIGNHFKYGYFKDSEGAFAQVGIIASKIQELTNSFSYQQIVDSLANEDTVLYALILDKNLKAIADSDYEDIGLIYENDEEYINALDGKLSGVIWHYDRIGQNVLEIAAPIYRGNDIIGILGIGLSMENVYSSIYFIILSFTIITVIMVLFFYWIQKRNVIQPIRQLDENIKQIDIENNLDYILPLPERDTFIGLFSTINNLIYRVNKSFHQLKEKEEYISHIAYHDPLTNLPNRRLFTEKLESELNSNRSGAVMILDIDNFKGINDTLGHIFGDKVLQKVADNLLEIKEENIYLSKFGGDEFLILLTGEDDITKIENYVIRIMAAVSTKLEIEGHDIYLTCSLGVTLYPINSNNVDQLIMNADMALYSVKSTGKNNYMFFSEEMVDKVNQKITVENILRKALKDNGFKLLYQPQVCTFTGNIVGFEALLRIKDENVSPGQFIPVAEETRMIIEIGRWITEEVINQINSWKIKGLDIKPIAINFSAVQLDDEDYFIFLKNKLEENRIEAKYIEIEITESLFMERKDKTIEFLKQLRSLGVKIALDDFGTGYSSLSYLTFLPVDKLKIDKTLSDRYLELNNSKVIEGVISLAHSLDLEVVAEGIEDLEQYNQLQISKCNYIQGYLFSRPLEVEAVEKIYYDNLLEKINYSR
ncbi:EAL domain-containing protein [Serpentinicella alkaliphila]|uniref:Diguanylate cyclase (GGDEF)-like protein n=1 Tax=Serpentinicella alkaliphila TaxID=1734049 RepID=A0A4R2TBI4_9FIRM|nr:EAL domain-containing protein [Serpentinicella alkaliphila]TCQ00588.1 diguanylate cyclase (GGDEF)-like protein [Serpentinicella alkaliphila]